MMSRPLEVTLGKETSSSIRLDLSDAAWRAQSKILLKSVESVELLLTCGWFERVECLTRPVTSFVAQTMAFFIVLRVASRGPRS